MISRLLLIGFCLLSCNLFGQIEDESQKKEAKKFAVVVNHSPRVGDNFVATSLECEFRLIRDPNKIFNMGFMGGAQYVDFDFLSSSEGIGGFGGSYFLLGKGHFFEVDLGMIYYYDRDPYVEYIFGGASNDGFTGYTWWPLLSVGYRYESNNNLVFKTGVSSVGFFGGLGVKF